MFPVSETATWLLLASLVSGAPSQEVRSSKHFSLGQIRNENHVRNGTAAMAHDVAKWKGRLAKGRKRSNGATTASPTSYDSEYLCQVTVGTQTFNVDVDTGSSDFWLLGQSLGTPGHNLYNPAASNQIAGETWSISYGDGSSASGTVYNDTLNVGGAIIKYQGVEYATKASSTFTSDSSDGLLGLAFDSINTASPVKEKNPMTNLINSGAISLPVFTANLKHQQAGVYDFGYIDSTQYTGTITYASVDSSQGFWSFTSQGYSVGTSAKTLTLSAIADTGTTLIYVPNSVINAYYSQVAGARYSYTYGGVIFPCSATLPSFSVKVNGYNAVVPGSYMNYAPTATGATTCFGGMQSSSSIGLNILGDVFLKSQFVVFDRGSTRLGLAAKPVSH